MGGKKHQQTKAQWIRHFQITEAKPTTAGRSSSRILMVSSSRAISSSAASPAQARLLQRLPIGLATDEIDSSRVRDAICLSPAFLRVRFF